MRLQRCRLTDTQGFLLLVLLGSTGLADIALSAPGISDPSPYGVPAATALTAQVRQEGGPPPDYLGTDACLLCHALPIAPGQASHASLLTFGELAAVQHHACEVCHGPGSAHTVGGGNQNGILHPLRTTAEVADAICLECHQWEGGDSSGVWDTSPHAGAGLSCVTCHQPHHAVPGLLRPFRGATRGDLMRGDELETVLVIPEPPFAGPESTLLQIPYADLVGASSTLEQFCASCHPGVASTALHQYFPADVAGQLNCATCHDPHHRFPPTTTRPQ
ncbi:MAG: hypothetical protein GEEBNDBF_01016 [bacterium]|nr:hypothetical protein [bacterium]